MKRGFTYIFLKRLIICLAIFMIVVPIAVMVVWSFTNSYVYPNILPNSFGLRGWSYVFLNNHRVIESLKNSVIISISTMVITIAISIPCAKALAFENFWGKRIVEVMVFMPVVIPPISIGMGLNMQFIKLGIARTYLGVILVCIVPCIPYAVNMIKDVFLIIGKKYFEQSRMLGASRIDTLRLVMIPMIMPGIMSAGIMCFIISFSQYFLVYLIGGGRINTFTMDMFPFIQSGDRMIASVYGVIFILMTMVLLSLMEYILRKIYRKEMEGYFYV